MGMAAGKIIPPSFFQGSSKLAARGILGKYLVVKKGRSQLAYQVNEVEVYAGFNDKASHASRGLTERNRVMYAAGGRIYVYLCYGIHWMLNIVTGPKDYPAALLIRGAGDLNGPGKLTRGLGINKRFNGKLVVPETKLWFEDQGVKVKPRSIILSPRIGVDYAGPVWSKKLYRYNLSD